MKRLSGLARYDFLIHGVILVICLGLAHAAWKGEPALTREQIIVLDPGRGGLKSLDFNGNTSVATLAISGDPDAPEMADIWVTAGKRKPVAPPAPKPTPAATAAPDGGVAKPATEPAEPDVAPKLRSFPGNAQAGRIVRGFSPLRAVRQLDDLDDATLAEMGLRPPTGKLTVDTGQARVIFDIGADMYGASHVYLRREGGRTAYLVSSAVISPLRHAEMRLIDRKPLRVKADDLIRADITTPDGARKVRLERPARGKPDAHWTRAGDPDARPHDEVIEKLLTLRVTTYPTDDERPSDGEIDRALRIDLHGRNGSAGQLELGRAQRPDSAGSASTERLLWYGRSGRTRSWVPVSQNTAADLVDALPALLEP